MGVKQRDDDGAPPSPQVSSPFSRAWKHIRNRTQSGALRCRGLCARVVNLGAWTCGTGLLVGRGVDVVIYGQLQLGARVHLADGCQLSVAPGAVLKLGDDVFVGRQTVIVASSRITIGNRVLIAEHSSIRDGDHQAEAAARAAEKELRSIPISISDDVWIGAGVRVLRGVTLAQGCIVAANAAVRGVFGPNDTLGGVPARVLRSGRSAGARASS